VLQNTAGGWHLKEGGIEHRHCRGPQAYYPLCKYCCSRTARCSHACSIIARCAKCRCNVLRHCTRIAGAMFSSAQLLLLLLIATALEPTVYICSSAEQRSTVHTVSVRLKASHRCARADGSTSSMCSVYTAVDWADESTEQSDQRTWVVLLSAVTYCNAAVAMCAAAAAAGLTGSSTDTAVCIHLVTTLVSQ
jgi:hypothetical protein